MGLDLDRAKVDGSARYIMAAYSAVFVCVQFMFETYRKCKYRKGIKFPFPDILYIIFSDKCVLILLLLMNIKPSSD